MRSVAILLISSSSLFAEDPPRLVKAQARKVVTVEEIVIEPGRGPVKKPRDVTVTFQKDIQVAPTKSALILCDVWDDHWCQAAAKRCDVLAKSIADVVADARKQGYTIIHCPSDTMDFYKDSPARKRSLAVREAEPPKNRDLPDPPLPIDDTDGGCDDAKPLKPFKAWKRQHAAIRMDDEKDYITDNGKEVFNILKEKKLDTVFVMGVHTNMCVLNRSFAIKQLRRWEINCFLVRDLTDAMYNPTMRPQVTHSEGTNLVIAHIETHWCPSVTSSQLWSPKK